MPFPCRAHAFPLPCCAANGLEYAFPIWFTQHGRAWFTPAMPRPCHPRPCPYSQGHGTARPSRAGVWATCSRSVSSDFPRGVSRSSYQTHTNCRCRWPVSNQTPFVMDKEKSGSSTLQKKKTMCYTVGLAVRIFPATIRTFTKDTGTVGAWQGRCMACVN